MTDLKLFCNNLEIAHSMHLPHCYCVTFFLVTCLVQVYKDKGLTKRLDVHTKEGGQ